MAFSLAVDHLVVDRETLEPLLPAHLGGPAIEPLGTLTESGAGIRSYPTDIDGEGAGLLLKPNAPMPTTTVLTAGAMNGILFPTGAHPWASTPAMDPVNPASANARPWSSSSHIRIPFADDQAFGRLHTAIRMVLPLLPAISAASPFELGERTGACSARVLALLPPQRSFPELTGSYIPELALDQTDYFRIVLEPIARALADHGAADSVDYQLANKRAAVPSFEHAYITISIADTQECASADVAVAEITVAVVNAMRNGRWVSNYLQRAWHENDLLAILSDIARSGSHTVITNSDFLLMFGLMRESATAAELWRHLYRQLRSDLSEGTRIRLAHILDHGSLAERIVRRTGDHPDRDALIAVYRELCDCLREDRAFV